MATYSVTIDARQDAALADYAAKHGATAQDVLNGQVGVLLQRIVADFEQVDADDVKRAYASATPAKRLQVRTALGL